MSSKASSKQTQGPSHVAIIMDGNGRWARDRGLPRIEGHRRGVDNIRDILKAAQEMNITHLTLFAFSVENWKRPPDEIAALMNLLEHFLTRNTRDLMEKQIRLRVIGRPEELPEKVQEPLRKALESTAGFDRHFLNVALNYGSRSEVVDAVRSYAENVKKGLEDPANLDWPAFARHLYTADIPDPDLIIRTSGETRLSNFLLLQSAYSEMFFSPVYWPDFKRQQFIEAVESYKHRQRRFGKTGEQIQAETPDTAILHS